MAPTITTVFEIIALAAPLIRTTADVQQHAEAAGTAPEGIVSSHSSDHHHHIPHVPGASAAQHAVQIPAAPVRFLLLLSLRLARGWAPAVVVAQGVRLISNIVQQQGKKDNKAGREGTEG